MLLASWRFFLILPFVCFMLKSYSFSPSMLSQKPTPVATTDDKKVPRKNPLADKPFAELKASKDQALKENNKAVAVKYLDAMRLNITEDEAKRLHTTETELARDILLEMATIYLELQEWEKAERACKEFMLIYPGADSCAYAHYKAVEAGWNLTLSSDRDQTKTEETLALAKEFFTNHPTSDYAPEVTKLATLCRQKLFESDMNVVRFYFNAHNIKAAQKRLELITKEHIPHLPTAQPQVLELHFSMAQAQQNTQAALRAQLTLGQEFPDHEITKRLVPDLGKVKSELASLEQKLLTPVTLPSASPVTVAQTPPQDAKNNRGA